MNKFCVRCGALFEAPNANQKYCAVCAHNVQLEQQAKWRRRKGKTERVMGLCAWCGKAMVKKTPDQKYHKDCARKAEGHAHRLDINSSCQKRKGRLHLDTASSK